MQKFQNPKITADGSERASVRLKGLETLWFNTGTLCNLACDNCYIESSPTNDRLVYISAEDVTPYLDEIENHHLPTKLIGLTGGEPFINPHIISILEEILDRGLELLILTNATSILKRHHTSLLKLKDNYGDKLHLRVSLDHFTPEVHNKERGDGNFEKTIQQLQWLYKNGFNISIASRSLVEETQTHSIQGHQSLLQEHGIDIDLKEKLVVFPEMKSKRDLPEITTQCWDILGVSPDDQMCASERMIVKRKGDETPVVMPCTLLAYDENFILGQSLEKSKEDVYLNHKFCAEFCVLGGASCSSTK